MSHNGQDGEVLSEISNTGAPLADYIYLNGNLVARVGSPENKGLIVPWLFLLLGE